jgi:hypothetical protein
MHKPGADSTNPNPVRLELTSKRLSKHEHSGLGSPISRKRGERKKPSRGGSHHNMPTLATLNHSRQKRAQSMHNPKEINVNNPPPVLFRGIKKLPRNSNPSISHNNIGHPMLSKNMLNKPRGSGTIGDIKLKSSPTNIPSSPNSGFKIKVNTQNVNPFSMQRQGGSPPNPTTSPGNKSQLPPKPRTPNPSPPQLPRGSGSPNKLNKLPNNPSQDISPIPNSPMPCHKRPPPKPLTPWISSRKNTRSNKGIPNKRNLLHRSPNHPSLPPRNPPKHIIPIKLNPITSIPILSMKPPPKSPHPPNQLRQKRHLKSSNIPGMHPLPNQINQPSPPHPNPNLPKIRPRDGGKG